jgi:hypothetical protein
MAQTGKGLRVMGKQVKRIDFDPKGNAKIINITKQDPDRSGTIDDPGTIKDRGVLFRGIGKAIGKASKYLDPH